MGLKKQVIQFNNGEKVAVFSSVNDASVTLGVSPDRISKCCNGKLKQVNGFTFKYTGEYSNRQNNDGEFKCPYCENRFKNYNGLCKHVNISHVDGIMPKENLLALVKYNGKRPKCKCGCGEYTGISYDGGAHFCDYVKGHASRVHNNWGHNESAINKSAKTRKIQYETGERVQWNKGKTWDETYTDSEQKKLLEVYKDEKRNNKIRNALKGVHKSKEHKKALKRAFNTEKYKSIHREQMRNRLTSGEFSLSSKIEKKFIKECIEPLGVDYETQHYIVSLHHYCDVYVQSKNLIIEFQGDYWHGNPKKYLKEELSEYQLEKVKKDEELRKYCAENSINLIEIWESDFKRDPDSVKTIIKEGIIS